MVFFSYIIIDFGDFGNISPEKSIILKRIGTAGCKYGALPLVGELSFRFGDN